MCGIVGFNWRDVSLIRELAGLLSHRGPDQEGFYTDDDISLGHRRLSVLDLSLNGRQPMQNEDGSVIVIFNGEIFNFKALKEDLLAKGHVFTSGTDTEVLVHLYEEHDFDIPRYLDGQFAFTIFDKKRNVFFIARDRVGIIPLYYYFDGQKFIFASELKPILASGVDKSIDMDALQIYLRFGYIFSPYCILKNTRKLEPGTSMVFDISDKQIKKKDRYWQVEFNKRDIGFGQAKEILRKTLYDSVSERLIADVPVGAFLSGGVDSSAVSFLIKKTHKHLKTFSVRFEYREFDESRYARLAAKHLGTEHYEITLKHSDMREMIRDIQAYYDEPFGDSSAIPTYFVSRFARKHVTVCLSGDGGDELLAGYKRYRYFFILRCLNRMPNFLKKTIGLSLSLILKVHSSFELERIRELVGLERMRDLQLYERLSEKIDRRYLSSLLAGKVDFVDTTGACGSKYGLDAIQEYDIIRYLEGDILTKVDRAAMAVNLETRPPFLDHDMIDVCLGMASNRRLAKGIGKWILKQAFKGVLPSAILNRKKMGFGVPIKHYLKNELRDLTERYVYDYDGHDFFDRKFIAEYGKTHEKKDTTRLFWNIMMFNMWHERWIRRA